MRGLRNDKINEGIDFSFPYGNSLFSEQITMCPGAG